MKRPNLYLLVAGAILMAFAIAFSCSVAQGQPLRAERIAAAQRPAATAAQTEGFFLGREEALRANVATPAVNAPPADICTGNYVFKRASDQVEMIGWPNDWVNTEYQGGAAHTITRHDISLGKDWSCCDQDTGGNPAARGYPRPPDVATYAMERFVDCYVDEPPQVPSSYLTACNKPTPPGTQSLPAYPIAQTQNAGKRAAWLNQFGCNVATPTPTVVPTPPPTASPYADWIEQLWKDGISSGCGGGNFCPKSNITREQLAVWLVKAMHGPGFVPPHCVGVFNDVGCAP